MFLIKRLLLGLTCLSFNCFAIPNILFNSNHAISTNCISSILGANAVNSSVYVDATQSSTTQNSFINQDTFKTYGTNSGNSYYQVSGYQNTNGTIENKQPYLVLSQSSTGYNQASDTTYYSSLVSQGAVYLMAMAPSTTMQPGTSPPVAMSNITYNGDTGSGAVGPGTEFAMPDMSGEYPGCIGGPNEPGSTSPSNATATFAQLIAIMKNNHPTWNLFDIKGAFRQTASNWPTYSQTNYGYGVINYDNATAIANTNSIYLQPPTLKLTAINGGSAELIMYPFLQTRRTAEVIYSVNANCSWPTKNEYVLADLQACGSLIYTSNGTDVTPTKVYTPVLNGLYTFAAFTTDGTNYSAFQPAFGQKQVFLTPVTQCH